MLLTQVCLVVPAGSAGTQAPGMVGTRSIHAIWMHEGQSLSLTLRAAKLCKSSILPICPAVDAGMTAYFNSIADFRRALP